MKYLLSKTDGEGFEEPQLIVSSMTEAKSIRKIIDPDETNYVIHEVPELG